MKRREFIRCASLLAGTYGFGAWNAGVAPQLERVQSDGEPIFGDLP